MPARGEACAHLSCVDLFAYLVSNLRTKAFNSRWRCPVCSLRVRPQDLRIDGFLEVVLAATTEKTQEVIVAADGSWRPAKETAIGSTMAPIEAVSCMIEDECKKGPCLPAREDFMFDLPKVPTKRVLRRRWHATPSSSRGTSQVRGRQRQLRARRQEATDPSLRHKRAAGPKLTTEQSGGAQRVCAGNPRLKFREERVCSTAFHCGKSRGAIVRARRLVPKPPQRAIALDSDGPTEVLDSDTEKGTCWC